MYACPQRFYHLQAKTSPCGNHASNFTFLSAVQPREKGGAGKGHLGVAVLTPVLLPSLDAQGLSDS